MLGQSFQEHQTEMQAVLKVNNEAARPAARSSCAQPRCDSDAFRISQRIRRSSKSSTRPAA